MHARVKNVSQSCLHLWWVDMENLFDFLKYFLFTNSKIDSNPTQKLSNIWFVRELIDKVSVCKFSSSSQLFPILVYSTTLLQIICVAEIEIGIGFLYKCADWKFFISQPANSSWKLKKWVRESHFAMMMILRLAINSHSEKGYFTPLNFFHSSPFKVSRPFIKEDEKFPLIYSNSLHYKNFSFGWESFPFAFLRYPNIERSWRFVK